MDRLARAVNATTKPWSLCDHRVGREPDYKPANRQWSTEPERASVIAASLT